MRYVKWTLIALIVLFIGGFFHYTLPQHDIVRIVNTYEERQDIDGWTTLFWQEAGNGTVNQQSRDVQFIQAVRPNGKSIVYRNEDTGWGWPPYFKFDTANLYTEANDAISTKDNPEWVSVTHYGWRSEILSIFPNAIAIKPVSGPDARIIPWVNIIILTLLAVLILTLYRMWQQFRERTIEPLVEDVEDVLELADEKKDSAVDKVKRWFKR
ncbi:DUF1523 family protein [Celeribacter halophilus]|jgi:hypothetical protein|uniref:DUF1523 family protein n=1 Tax=Celeribacter halophilus TaxID=576117 RepID=A0A1I3V4H9_9RHOB|nr:DUF1523 family protein [Celeribacter halophilus]MBU2888986.1 DUF1523 family protein [Celeribacter halophilus]MDO6456420.1 DUF1523 family protein [Celeribacter halophilus]MDO6510485.1 DUF1523 family protein [Celeribacter halophilus]MDO6722883.1 DUF1523 family protein [Celeribacter halophilus]PZX09766.1 uncharacterized protein DUF1523 [Celeribacter halophilus]